jgi:hypothetical protein
MLLMGHIHHRGELTIQTTVESLGLSAAAGQDDIIQRVAACPLDRESYELLKNSARAIAATERFRDVIRTFATPSGETPAGFRIAASLKPDGLLEIDLIRDIGYDKNGIRRPTGVIYSADSANPYEVAPIAGILGNLTCNPGIVYDLFINNPKANVANRFSNLEEVMTELGGILGPGVDVSVELENPFENDFEKILAEIAPYERILSRHRLVVKVPHTGPVNGNNFDQLLTGERRLSSWYAQPSTEDAFRSHNLALRLREHGYRVNYTLMFEPYQTALALQARPYFINAFVRQRLVQSQKIDGLLNSYRHSRDKRFISELRTYLVETDHLAGDWLQSDMIDVLHYAEDLISYRSAEGPRRTDGLDSLRHSLRLLKQANLPDTRLIVCSMEGANNYPDIDKLMVEPEFADVMDRLIITAEPAYLARFTSSSQVVSYQRRFMAAAASAKN